MLATAVGILNKNNKHSKKTKAVYELQTLADG
jgi:hypothetical protein